MSCNFNYSSKNQTRVTRSTRDNHIICRAEVQVSTDRLTASVRDLENASLPIKQS